ncbi:YifB family Mg chelatase-like AAA ATPase [Proteiniphilum sp. UBA1028]|jgi:magnesium chelatase family protein|uniref:YifB family Mg chelatase-like AAA ATPase n=1 Tax=Proteiniphilum sp. UBA1028 TaxID=1947251 RepID=UPI0025DE7B8E|nr:YifB family Mg chelatase-like AAA ATPase [Proteiniphilum sp. UBA1028]
MLVKLFGAAVQGINATLITIEVNVSRGIRFLLVGLPDTSVKESHERIVSALEMNGLKFPRHQIVINMSPADIRKEGSAYDLPLAIGILSASGAVSPDKLNEYVMMGELSLDGSILPLRGALSIAMMAKENGFRGLVVPTANAKEAAVVDGLAVYGVDNIRDVVDFFNGQHIPEPTVVDVEKEFREGRNAFDLDFSDVKGQESVKRALEVAAAGGHNVIMVGAPGSGKSMMAKRLPTILPPFSLEEALETTRIHSVAGRTGLHKSLMIQRPFRAPHHTISNVAMVGGGTYPQPGEISLAHNGILFLDELPEFNRNVLEVMRQPLEDRKITISRARFSVDYPASFMLVAAMNPCPCGFHNHPGKECVCPPGAVNRYLNKISGPLLDRIDMHIEITPVPFEKISERTSAEHSDEIRGRVIRAREIQMRRFCGARGVYCNAQMTGKMLHKYVSPDNAGLTLLKAAMERLNLSARAYDRILKMSRTVADLEGSEQIKPAHLAEAINYRNLDRSSWAG